MNRIHNEIGFTLVELAVAMTIIGLLIGGILKDQELRRNAAITATITQVDALRAATSQFRDTYSYLPGDFPRASSRLPGCIATCDPDAAFAGNGIISWPRWGEYYQVYQEENLPASGTPNKREGGLYWVHLLLADLISGVTPEALTASAPQTGITHPALRMDRGGWMVGYNKGDLPPDEGSPATTNFPAGHFLLASSDQWSSGQPNRNTFSPKQAAHIDRKIDDGGPATGFVFALGPTLACFTSATILAYNESVSQDSCDLLFKLF